MKRHLICIFLFSCQSQVMDLSNKVDDLPFELDKCKIENSILRDSVKALRTKTVQKSRSKKKQKKEKTAQSIIYVPEEIKEPEPAIKETYYSNDCGSVQCSGSTKKGKRCRNMTKNCNGRCYRH